MSRPRIRRVLVLIAAAAAAASIVLGGLSPGRVLAAFPTLEPPFTQEDFLTGFPNDGHFGPTGMAFSKNGDILVADAADGNLYRFSATGGKTGTPFARPGTILGMVFAGDGKLYASKRLPSSIVELDPSDGHVIRTVASGFSNLLAGLAVDPKSSDLFVTDQASNTYASSAGVFRVKPSNGTVTTYASGELFPAPDGLIFDTDGTLYVANERASGDIVRVDRQGNATVLVTLPGGPDGLAVGKPGGSLAGSLLVNRNDGVISRIDLTQSPVSVSTFAGGGSRGDFVAVSPDGYLFATQTDVVVRFSPASFQAAVGGGSSTLPLKVYSGFIAAALLALIAIGAAAWWRRIAIRREQLAVVAANPTDVEIPGALAGVRAAPGISRPQAAGRLTELENGRVHPIGDGSLTIGAAPECSVVVPRGPGVASHHARVWFREGRYLLHHTGDPSYVTLVAGKAIEWVTLESGDEIQIGASRFIFEE